jgi:hypothetical protein
MPTPTRSWPERFLVAFSFAGEERRLVRDIAAAVEARLGRGTVFLDEWFEYYLAGNDADLKLQALYGTGCALAVVCVSERYGGKPWTRAEHAAIRARQMQAEASADATGPHAILPIRVGDGEVPGILFNAIVPDVRQRSVDAAAQLIIDRLRLVQPEDAREASGAGNDPAWPASPPPLVWPMADHHGVREHFAALLTGAATCRFLPVCGPSETGKSHITKQMLANALAMPGIACGRFDFKGGVDMDAELGFFVQELGVPVPPPSPSLNERLGRILDDLVQRGRPTLLIFDTYERAGQPQRDWVERQLLIRLLRAPFLRVVIAGQQVPQRLGAVWVSVAHEAIELAPPPPEEWLDYGRQHRPDLKLEDVETACRLARDKASLLAQLLGPAA